MYGINPCFLENHGKLWKQNGELLNVKTRGINSKY